MLKIKIYSVSGKVYEELEKYNYDYENQTIIINSLEDLLNLPQEIGKDIIIDRTEYTSLHQNQLTICDDYIE